MIAWASRKRLDSPKRLYEVRLLDTEMRLNWLQVRSLSIARWARWGHQLGIWINPPPKRFTQGAAAHYRRQ
ncbi:MAG: hypothetical protein K8I82_01660 [Anaerolineae bacterium]|nr:hypothetical protein [Anaerolineae bacterium]